jgi:hypothetical protein
MKEDTMSAITQMIDKFFPHPLEEKHSRNKVWSKVSFKKAVEAGWGMMTFLLFLALGPFSAIAVVLSVASLVPNDEHLAPESAN